MFLKKSVTNFFLIVLIAASLSVICRVYLFQVFLIPTDSMAMTIFAGDYVGIRKIQLNSNNLGWFGGGSQIARNDIVVFKDPLNTEEYLIKRIIGLPGDTISIVGTYFIVNGKKIENPATSINDYYIRTANRIQMAELKEQYALGGYDHDSASVTVALNPGTARKISENPTVTEIHVEQQRQYQHGIFPEDLSGINWNNDNYGPVVIPRKNYVAKINPINYALYKKIIQDYECDSCLITSDNIYISGKPIGSIIFKANYFFLVGDNRNRSRDSRYWGFVHEDNVVGKAVLRISISDFHLKFLK